MSQVGAFDVAGEPGAQERGTPLLMWHDRPRLLIDSNLDLPLDLQESVFPVERDLLHLVVVIVALFAHALAVLLQLAKANLTLLVHVKHAVLQAFQIDLSGASVDFLLDLVDLIFHSTEPIVESLFHLSWIDAAVFHDLRAFNQVGP